MQLLGFRKHYTKNHVWYLYNSPGLNYDNCVLNNMFAQSHNGERKTSNLIIQVISLIL